MTAITPERRVLVGCRPGASVAHGVWSLPDGRILLAEAHSGRVTVLRPRA